MKLSKSLMNDIRKRNACMLEHVWMHDRTISHAEELVTEEPTGGQLLDNMLVGYTSEMALMDAATRSGLVPQSVRKVPVNLARKVAEDRGLGGVAVVDANGECVGRIYA